MTRVAWLQDAPGYTGGAELTATALRAAAPNDLEIVDCPPGEVDPDVNVVCIHNCVTYSLLDLEVIKDRPAFKYFNDVGSWYPEAMMALLRDHAESICCSPLQAEYMGLEDAHLIPPPINLSRFEEAARRVNGNRQGIVSAASWRNLGKGARRVAEWAGDRPIDYYGGGPFAPPGSSVVPYARMPKVLAAYEVFCFLPSVIEPFGRLVAEAWASGCRLVVNDLVGARHWIEQDPDALYTAADSYWGLVLDRVIP